MAKLNASKRQRKGARPRDTKGGPVIESVTETAMVPHSVGESAHLRALKPIPEHAADAPVEWADKHLESLVPLAAKEKEWQLKFGNDAARDKVASELLAMRSISAKKDAGTNIPAVINLMTFENPWAKPKALPATITDSKPVGESEEP